MRFRNMPLAEEVAKCAAKVLDPKTSTEFSSLSACLHHRSEPTLDGWRCAYETESATMINNGKIGKLFLDGR